MEEAALDSYTLGFLGHERGLSWTDILDYRLVVVLGEPGSGKSWEFRERTHKLRDEGKIAFFVPLDRLVASPLDASLGSMDYTDFTLWRQGNDQAFFFLDSVDEAKHRKVSDFILSLDKLSEAIGPDRLQRVRVFISSRISEWRPQSDASEVEARFPNPHRLRKHTDDSGHSNSRIEPKEGLFVVHLLPLDRTKVRMFVESRGVDANPFLNALDQHHAWDFARRPIDVLNLLNFWKANNRLGSLTEIMEFDLRANLKETCEREKQDPLTPEQSQEGAEILGAAAVFCRQLGFRVPDDALILDKPAIDVSACLPENWRPEHRFALLSRPIFDSASYGRIRFHHRRVAEFLAARWLTERMRSGCPKPVLEYLLVDKISGDRPLIRPSMAPIAAWMSCGEEPWNKEVRSWASRFSPSIYLRYGDSSCLPLDFKRALLQSLANTYRDRNRVWLDSENESLSRLADPGLADQVSSIIRDKTAPIDIRSEMLQMVRYGRLFGCLNTALEVIVSAEYPEELKLYAVAAIRDIGENEHRKTLAEIATQFNQIESSLCGYICEALYPDAIDLKGLVGLLRKIGGPSRSEISLPSSVKGLLRSKLHPEKAGELVLEFVELAQEEPHVTHNGKPTKISAKFQWLEEPILVALMRLLEKKTLTPVETDAATEALWLLGQFRNIDHLRDLKKKLNTATARHLSVRQSYTWRLVREFRSKRAKDPSFADILFGHYELLQLLPEDLSWLIDDIKNRKNQKDTELALRFAWELLDRKAMANRKIRHQIFLAISDNPGLRQLYHQLVKNSAFPWARRFWYRTVRPRLADGWWWEKNLISLKNSLGSVRWKFRLHVHIRKLTTGQAIWWIGVLAHAAAGKEDHHQWAPRNWNGLRKEYGPLISFAARKGCKVSWRRYTPPLPHEKPDPSQTDYRVIIGLAGIQASISDGELDFSKMNDQEAHLAVRYAVNEMNGFAPWLPEMAKYRPEAVRDVISACVKGEWDSDPSHTRPSEVLHDLVWHGEGVAFLVEEHLVWEHYQFVNESR